MCTCTHTHTPQLLKASPVLDQWGEGAAPGHPPLDPPSPPTLRHQGVNIPESTAPDHQAQQPEQWPGGVSEHLEAPGRWLQAMPVMMPRGTDWGPWEVLVEASP